MAQTARNPVAAPASAASLLASVGQRVQSAFDRDRSLLSIEQYLELALENPRAQARGAAQYVRDVFDYFGSDEVDTPGGRLRRYRLFDLELDGEGPVAGQEEAQNALYRILGSFVRLGRVNKLILLHGPNGSAKSSLVAALVRSMERYSRTPEGALYRFGWVFPAERLVRGPVGFGERAEAPDTRLESYAHLEGEAIEARLDCPLSDHPLLLLPKPERRALLERALDGPGPFVLPRYLLEGELCHRCRQVYSALLSAYRGNYRKVLRHVQVERFHVDRRYQRAAVTVEPQLTADAAVRQASVDRSPAQLPPALQHVALIEPTGPLVRANRGLIELSDLLKRPVEAFKYLLGVSETASLPLEPCVLHLDQVLVASANEEQLAAFKQLPDFASFRGRIELVRVPYLRRVRAEQSVYDAQVCSESVGRHVAPHATWTAASWAVLTRLKKPIAERYPRELRSLVDSLSPREKLALYDRGQVPDRLSSAEARELRRLLPDLYHESDADPLYEGGAGASAREVKSALFHAAQASDSRCLTPLQVLAELEALCRDRTLYAFLQQEVVKGFHDHLAFVRAVEEGLLDRVDEEVRESLGLVSDAQHTELFERYVVTVSHWVKGEKMRNRITGEFELPSVEQMQEMEAVIMAPDDDRREFRRALIGAIGAYTLDHPHEPVDYPRVFPDLFRRLREHYFEERKRTLRRSAELILKHLSGEGAALSPRERAQVQSALKSMIHRFGYCEHCAREALVFLLKRRYA